MKISVIGTGYVGLVTGMCFAELGNKVICIDVDEEKIKRLKQNIMPIYEPGLEEFVKKNQKEGRISFSTDTAQAVRDSEVIFIAVGTPSDKDGQADLRYVRQVAEEIGNNMNGYKIIVNKSTVPVGTGDIVSEIIRKHYQGEFDVVSNPEFLREGTAVSDTFQPDRIVIGNSSDKAKEIMSKLYEPFDCEIVFTDIKSAEMIKYASNAMLATQISFINSIANICEKVGADVKCVAKGMRLDKRIGKHSFLDAGAGYGGSCFPKDVKALVQTSDACGYDFKILKSVEKVNEIQKQSIIKKAQELVGDFRNKNIGVWGLAFKPKTDDMREAVSLTVIGEMLRQGGNVRAYDPVAEITARKIWPNLKYCPSPFEAAKDTHLLCVLTEWDEFRQIDRNELKQAMANPNIVDGRNVFDPEEMKELGFKYIGVGR